MNGKEIKNGEFIEIDVKQLFSRVLKKSWLAALVAVVCAAAVLLGTFLFVTPQYEASAMFYVNNSTLSGGDGTVTSSDISASRGLVDAYIVILQTRETLKEVVDRAGLDLSFEQISPMIEAEAIGQTQLLRVTVTNSDPKVAELIANTIAEILPQRITDIAHGTSASVVDYAVAPADPSSPSYSKNAIWGFVAGLAVAVLALVMREIFDVYVRSEDDIQQCCAYPVLAVVPDMSEPEKENHYGGDKKKVSAKRTADEKSALIGDAMSFASAEAYKLLRTKIQYSFAGDKSCRVIGVSSALKGEGKSLTAVNLAHTLSQLGSKVLLIDCDMRCPSIPEKLPVQKQPGLSGFLSGLASENTIFQYCGLSGDEQAFHVITSGQVPPNPMELLSSERMSKMLKQLRSMYDFVILDLPPVCEVSDALAIAKETDGMLMVVRQNYCNRTMLREAIRQFEFVGARILGVTYNCSTQSDEGYGKNGYGYGKKHYGYGATTKAVKAKAKK